MPEEHNPKVVIRNHRFHGLMAVFVAKEEELPNGQKPLLTDNGAGAISVEEFDRDTRLATHREVQIVVKKLQDRGFGAVRVMGAKLPEKPRVDVAAPSRDWNCMMVPS